jgi:hypothetical protein
MPLLKFHPLVKNPRSFALGLYSTTLTSSLMFCAYLLKRLIWLPQNGFGWNEYRTSEPPTFFNGT